MHAAGLFFLCIVIVLVAVIAAWNLVPSWRDKMRGYSTIVESLAMSVAGVFGIVAGGIQDAQQAGYLPPQLLAYVPFVLLLWMIVKRFQTTTPIGLKPAKPKGA